MGGAGGLFLGRPGAEGPCCVAMALSHRQAVTVVGRKVTVTVTVTGVVGGEAVGVGFRGGGGELGGGLAGSGCALREGRRREGKGGWVF